jgi:hypothetical protein
MTRVFLLPERCIQRRIQVMIGFFYFNSLLPKNFNRKISSILMISNQNNNIGQIDEFHPGDGIIAQEKETW